MSGPYETIHRCCRRKAEPIPKHRAPPIKYRNPTLAHALRLARMPLLKVCRTCRATLPPTAFGRDARHRDGLHRLCKACEAEYRAEHRDRNANHPKESGGRGGLDPTRYGDWEKDGLISDF